MFEVVAGIQYPLLGAIFLWAGAWKLFSQYAVTTANRSALSLIFRRPSLTVTAYKCVGLIEVGTSALLLMAPHRPWAMYLATGLSLGFVLYATFAMKYAPGTPCGCMSAAKEAISPSTVARASLLLALTIPGWWASKWWPLVFRDHPWTSGLLLVVEVLLFAWFSPEFRPAFDQIRSRLTSVPAPTGEYDCAVTPMPLVAATRILYQSGTYKSLSGFLDSGQLREHWRTGCWWFLSFEGEYHSRKVTVVFAVPVRRDLDQALAEVRAAVIDDRDQSVLLSVPPSPELATTI